jgi:hypothetical protein
MRSLSTNPILCKIKYLNRDTIDTASNISGVLGNAFHNAMNVYYGGSDVLVPINEAEAIEYGLKAGMEFLENYNDGLINFSKTIETKQKALELFSFCYTEYIKKNPYNKEMVISTEDKIVEKVNVEWRGKTLNMPIKLKGYIDLIERDEKGRLVITDYKTCYNFSDPDKIDGAKILQAVENFLLVYAKYGEEPYSIKYKEVKYTKNAVCKDPECKRWHDSEHKHSQVEPYELVFKDNDLYFDFYFRFYEDTIRALNGEMVYLPNVDAIFDNEVAIVAYIHRLDMSEETAKLMKKHKVENITDLLKKEIQSANSMKNLLKSVEEKFVSAKNINYEKMSMEEKIQTKMLEFGIMLQFDSKIEGATVDLYRYTPSIGVKMSRLRNFVDDIEQITGVSGIRVLAPIRGTKLVGFEIPKENRLFPSLPTEKNDFNFAVGITIGGEIRRYDFRTAPHTLVAGSSGSGKSVFLHAVVKQAINCPKIDLHLFDPKQVEFLQYDEMVKEYKHSPDGIKDGLDNLVIEMEKRYDKMKKLKVRDVSKTDFNYKFVVIDEYADLKLRSDIDRNIKLLAQKGRACGIHLILATQRASTKVIDGDIKNNFTTKVVFRMSKAIDSRVMIDEDGAERLLGKGDCLFCGDWGIDRLQTFNV